MGVLRMCWFVVLVTVVCASLAPVSSREGYRRKKIDNVLLELLVNPVTGEMGEGVAELLWINCRLDLIHLKDAVGNITDETNTGSRSLEKENVRRILRVMHPQSKRNLLNCLRRHNRLLPVSGEKAASKRGFLEPNVHRRKLGNELIRHASRVSASTSPPNSSRNSTVVIAVAVTALVAFLIAAVYACFYFKLCGGDKPLLRPSSSSSVKEGVLVQDGKANPLPPERPADPKPLPGGYGPPPSPPGQSGTPPPPTPGQFGTPPQPTPGQLGTPPPPTLGQSGTPPPPPGQLGTPPPPPPTLGHSGTPPPALGQSGTSSPPTLGQSGIPLLTLSQSGTPRPTLGQSGTPPLTLDQFGTFPSPPSGQSGTPPPPPGQSGTPPPPPGPNDGPLPPPPPAGAPRPPQPLGYGRTPFGQKQSSNSSSGEAELEGKTKLKPFFWDKVQANPDNSMVWHQLKEGSFQFNEEKIETLFGFARTEAAKKAQDPADQFVRIIDPKKAQNLAILLRALNVTTEDTCDALLEGNELPPELLHTLLKMAPTAEEELKLRMFSGEVSQLGPAEKFLKALVDIPFAFKRLESLLFMGSFQDDVAAAKEAFATLEVASNELKNSRLFLKLLEAVLKTGNRMNDGTFRGGAHAFKLDTLLKLSDVKGTDGKTTLLHFVVQEIIRTEGLRAARVAITNSDSDDRLLQESNDSEEYYRNIGLQVVSGLTNDLRNVKKAAAIDAEALTGTVARLGHGLLKAWGFLNSEMGDAGESDGFRVSLKSFVEYAEGDVEFLLVEERRIAALVKSAGDYFHGNSGKSEGFRLFSIVRDFLIMLDKACKEVKERPTKPPPRKAS